MREIKFRGKRLDSGEWVYGSLLQSEIDINELGVKCEIHERFASDFSIKKYSVDPKSVGEWTGLKDKNGKEIYEGDIVALYKVGEKVSDKPYFTGVVTDHGVGGITIDKDSDYMEFNIKNYVYEIIGNIYENPNLLQ